jgi:hypothetical protein
MQSAGLPPVLRDLKDAFSKALDGDARGTFWNDLWAFTASRESISMPINSKEMSLPIWIHEKLKNGSMGGIGEQPEHHPSVCLTQESLTLRGMQFSVATNSLGNSYVAFKLKNESGKPWSAGSIQLIFYLPIAETMHGPFFVIKPYLPLSKVDAQFDPYRKFLFAAGKLVYEDCGDLLVCTLDEVWCHFAHTPYKSPENISKPCIHVLPLDRVCTISRYWYPSGH